MSARKPAVRVVLPALVAALAVTLGVATPAQAAGPIKWGAEIRPVGSQTQLQAVQQLQTKVGRTLAANRDFVNWDSAFPTAYENGLKAQGTTILYSVATRRLNGTRVLWNDIANAQPGSAIYTAMVAWADKLRAFGAPIYVTMQHEPEAASKTSLGTATQYVAAWRKWVSIFRAEGATNVKHLWIMTAFSFRVATSDRRYAPKWYPGDDWVDGIGADAYNWFVCPNFNNPWTPLSTILSGQRTFALSHPNEEVWVPEFGSVADPNDPTRRAQWMADAQALFKSPGWERYVGVLYFDINGACDTRIDTDTATMNAFAAMGGDPYYKG